MHSRFIASLALHTGLVTTAIAQCDIPSFATAPSVTSAFVLDMVSADLNGDQREDLIMSGFDEVLVAVRLSNGLFGPTQSLPVNRGIFDIATADINGDGRADILALYSPAPPLLGLRLWYGNGQGQFAAPIDLDPGAGAICMTVADMNGDNRRDIVIGADTSPAGSTSFARPRLASPRRCR